METESPEAVIDDGSGCFPSISIAPIRLTEPISERGFFAAVASAAVEADATDQAVGFLQHDSKAAGSPGRVVLLHTSDPFAPIGFSVGMRYGADPASDFPIAGHVLHEPLPSLEEGNVVDHRKRKALTVIERRIAPFGAEVLEILHPPRRRDGGEHLGGRVVDVVTPRVGSDELHPISKAPVHLRRKPVIGGVALRHEPGDKALEAGLQVLRQDGPIVIQRGLESREVARQRAQLTLARSREVQG